MFNSLHRVIDASPWGKSLGIFCAIAVALVGMLLIGSMLFGISMPAQTMSAAQRSGTPVDISCTPAQVAVFADAPRLHVRCAASVGGILYFALSTSDAAQAARVLSVLTTAQVAGRTLIIRYDPADLSGASIGCQVNDCRLIRAAGFGP